MNVDRALIWLDTKRDKLVDTLPTILFFIALLWIVTLGFGSDYLLVVSPYTTLFETRLHKYNPPTQYARFFLVSAFALLAARVAVSNVVLSVLVNLCVPFFLVFMRSSQLNPRRYFPYTMLFCWLELRPYAFDAGECAHRDQFALGEGEVVACEDVAEEVGLEVIVGGRGEGVVERAARKAGLHLCALLQGVVAGGQRVGVAALGAGLPGGLAVGHDLLERA